MIARGWGAAACVFAAAACGSGEASIALLFPNAESREATRQLAVFAFSRDAISSAADVSCAELMQKLPKGEQIQGDPIDNPFEPPFEGKQITSFPSGDPVIFAVGYNSTADMKKPILHACTEDFETGGNDDDVPLEFQVIIPDDVTLVKVGGDRQVGHPGQELPLGLEVELRATIPGRRSERYALPGVAIAFKPSPELQLLPSSAGAIFQAVTRADGRAAARVKMPGAPGKFEVEGAAPAIAKLEAVAFAVGAIAPVTFGETRTIETEATHAIAVAAGNVSGSGAADVVVLACNGSADACRPGQEATDPPGVSDIVVIDDVLAASPRIVELPPFERGVVPSDLVVAALVPGAGDDIAYLNSRRLVPGTQTVLEGSEIVVLKGDAGGAAGITLEGRYALTASNAVGLVPYLDRRNDAFFSLLTTGQGRRKNDRPCRRNPSCLPPTNVTDPELCTRDPASCGCPADELCGCDPTMTCLDSDVPGVCLADDRLVDRLANEYPRNRTGFVNADGCHIAQMSCNKPSSAETSTCRCVDGGRNVDCAGRDFCYCKVPRKILIGVPGMHRFPYNLTAGALRSEAMVDIVVSTSGGLDFIRSTSLGSWEWKGQPVVNDRTHGVAIAELDGDRVNDVVWYSKTKCHEFSRQQTKPCPIVRADMDQDAAGCVGLALRESVDSVDLLKDDGCRRFPVSFSPDGMCTGDFNGDGGLDVALASRTSGKVAIYLGDGAGGLLSPPDEIDLPPGTTGGPLTCKELDGDGREDIVVVSKSSGDVVVLRTNE